VHRALELRASTVVDILEASDAFRRAARFEHALLACEADSRGRLGLEQGPYPQRAFFTAARAAAALVKPDAADLAAGGAKIAEAVRRGRIAAVTAVRKDFGEPAAP
jgi:tRNA nucleotidyltransferase (CCA-adding enzyme)